MTLPHSANIGLQCVNVVFLDHTVKPVLSGHSKNRQDNDLNDKWQLNEGRKYCRVLPLKDSALLLTCIKR